jgi:SAM-dependent methyltransferase
MLEILPHLSAVALEPEVALFGSIHSTLRGKVREMRAEILGVRIENFAAADDFDLVWLPLDFIGPPEIESTALNSVFRSLRPGGIVFASAPSAESSLPAACARLRAAIWRGGVLDHVAATELLRNAGFVEIADVAYSRGLRVMYAVKPRA